MGSGDERVIYVSEASLYTYIIECSLRASDSEAS